MNRRLVVIVSTGAVLILATWGYLFLDCQRKRAVQRASLAQRRKWLLLHQEAQKKLMGELEPIVQAILKGISSGDLHALDDDWIRPSEYGNITDAETVRKERQYLREEFEWLSRHLKENGPILSKEAIGPYLQLNIGASGSYVTSHTEQEINSAAIPWECINRQAGYGYWLRDLSGKIHKVAFLFFRVGNNWRIVEKGPN